MNVPYCLPEDFDLDRARHRERIETGEGVTLCVLKHPLTGERQLVHEDVVDYEGKLDHPAMTGLIGSVALALVWIVPIVGGLYVSEYLIIASETTDAWFVSYLAGGISMATGFILFNRALGTRIGTWVYRFQEWNDVKYLVMGRDSA